MAVRPHLATSALPLCYNKNRFVETSTAFFQHQIFKCSDVLWSFFSFRPGNRPTSCWRSENLCNYRVITSDCEHYSFGFIARQQEWLFFYFAVRSAVFTGVTMQIATLLKVVMPWSLVGRYQCLGGPCFFHWQFPANEDLIYNECCQVSSRLLSAVTSYQLVYY